MTSSDKFDKLKKFPLWRDDQAMSEALTNCCNSSELKSIFATPMHNWHSSLPITALQCAENTASIIERFTCMALFVSLSNQIFNKEFFAFSKSGLYYQILSFCTTMYTKQPQQCFCLYSVPTLRRKEVKPLNGFESPPFRPFSLLLKHC